jgi:hypothetical protein
VNFRQVLQVVLMATPFTQLGCSFLFLETAPQPGDPPIKRGATDDSICTERNTLPKIDTAVAGTTLGLVLLSLGPPSQGTGASGASEQRTMKGILVGSALAYSVISAVSAMWGFYHTGECRRYLQPQ